MICTSSGAFHLNPEYESGLAPERQSRIDGRSAHRGEPARIVLVPDRKIIKADGRDLSFVTVKIVERMERRAPRR